jgi:hypothetical protein
MTADRNKIVELSQIAISNLRTASPFQVSLGDSIIACGNNFFARICI